MSNITIWHNPRCGKSRDALKLLEGEAFDLDIVRYLDTPPSREELIDVLKMLGVDSARELMRTKEAIYKELNLKEEKDEEKLIDAMVSHPKLIERPVVIKEGRAAIGRPIEKVITLLQ